MKTAFVFCVCLFAMSPANAALMYQFIFDQSNYDAAPGATVNVGVLLRETATGGSVARLAAGGLDGLFAAGFSVNYASSTTGMGSTIPDSANPSSRIVINTVDFDDTGSSSRSDAGFVAGVFAAGTNINDGIVRVPVGNDFDVLIATLTFTRSLNPNDVTTLQLADFAAGADTAFLDGFSPDDTNQLTFSVATIGTAVAIPEPASLCLIGTLLTGGIIRLRRRGNGSDLIGKAAPSL